MQNPGDRAGGAAGRDLPTDAAFGSRRMLSHLVASTD